MAQTAEEKSGFNIWKQDKEAFMEWVDHWSKDTSTRNTLLSCNSFKYLPNIPERRRSEIMENVPELLKMSAKWQPSAFYSPHQTDVKYFGIEGAMDGIGVRARQRATAWLIKNQTADTPRIYPILGSEHFYFGNMNLDVLSISSWKMVTRLAGTKDNKDALSIYVIAAVEFIDRIYRGWNGWRGYAAYDGDVEDHFEFFPVFSLDLLYNGIRLQVTAFLTYLRWEDGLWFVVPHATWFLIHNIFLPQVERNHMNYWLQQLPLLRWSGIYFKQLERKWLVQANESTDPNLRNLASGSEILTKAYTAGLCLKCLMESPRLARETVKVKWKVKMGGTSGGSIWCLHNGPHGDNIGMGIDIVTTQMEKVWILAGKPPRFSVHMAKGHLPKRKHHPAKRKLYMALVELGIFLGPGVDHIPLQQSYQNGGNYMQIDFDPRTNPKGLPNRPEGPVSDAEYDFSRNDPTAPTGKSVDAAIFDSPSGPRWNIAFATMRCVHTWPDGWSLQPLNKWPLKPGFTLDDAKDCYSNTTFLPHEARLVYTTRDIEAAVADGRIPVMLGGGAEKRAIIQSLGGYAYYMRECIHCALSRVAKLRASAGLVVVLAVGWSGGSQRDERQ